MPNNGPHLVLYYYPYSFYSQKVIMALHQMKIKYQPKFVDTHRGKQFSPTFLALNPKGEVPVLVDDVRIIPDSEKIIDYLQDNFANGNPGLLPTDREIRTRVEQLHQTIHCLKIEALSYGASIYDDLGITPKPPYDCLTNRLQMKDYLTQRPRLLEVAAINNPLHAAALNNKLEEVREDSKVWKNRDAYEGLLIHFEKVMDECEAELASHDNPGWWLCSPEISMADVDFALLLYRLWQVGFEKRMWERNRPNIKRYFARVQTLESYRTATSLTEGPQIMEMITSPVFLGIVGTTAVLAGGYYLWSKKGSEISSALAAFFSEENSNEIPARPLTRTVTVSKVPVPPAPRRMLPVVPESPRAYPKASQFS